MSEWFEEFFGLIFIALFITCFVIGCRAGFKILAAKLPLPQGAQELLAS
jgi:hypothetical protein